MSEDDHVLFTANKEDSFPVLFTCDDETNADFVFPSPLAVNTSEMSVVTTTPLKYYNFDALPAKMMLFNNGLTVTLSGTWAAAQRPFVVGSVLTEKYRFSHVHFHWSGDDNVGSEHVINGQRHAMEMHLVFFKDSCRTIFEAEAQRNGCLTLAYLFDIAPDGHVGIEHITARLNGVRNYGQTSETPVFRLSRLVDRTPGEHFTYTGKADKFRGTHTVAKWIVFTKIFKVGRLQIEQFRRLTNHRGQPIRRNCRTAVSVTRSPGDGTNAIAIPCLVTAIFADDEKSIVDDRLPSRVLLCAKTTRTQLLRRKFNREKAVNLSSRTKTTTKTDVHHRTAERSDRVPTTTKTSTTSVSAKPSWK